MLIRHESNLFRSPDPSQLTPSDASCNALSHLREILCKLDSEAFDVGQKMELRHLRYFVAVAETESLNLAAKARLHTSQPSLSRRIRDLEEEIGAQRITRTARGIEWTPAGRAFLDHARLVLSQVDAAAQPARNVAHPAKPCFVMGFLTGHESTWMPETMQILRDCRISM